MNIGRSYIYRFMSHFFLLNPFFILIFDFSIFNKNYEYVYIYIIYIDYISYLSNSFSLDKFYFSISFPKSFSCKISSYLIEILDNNLEEVILLAAYFLGLEIFFSVTESYLTKDC